MNTRNPNGPRGVKNPGRRGEHKAPDAFASAPERGNFAARACFLHQEERNRRATEWARSFEPEKGG